MDNINDFFFDGYYKDIWKAIIPEQLTLKEVQFLIDHFQLIPGDRVLDMMCGYGRHSLALAERGVEVTAVDNLPDYINEIRAKVEESSLPLQAFQQSVLDYRPAGKYKLIICMGNSLNFFNAEETQKLLNNWAGALEDGGHILINSWSLAETVIPNFTERSEATHGGIDIVSTSSFLFHPTRIETETRMTGAGASSENKLAIDYIYSVNEIGILLNNSGFQLEEIYDIPGKKKYALGSPRAYIIARLAQE
ncbi:class I SAM-dependent methyltransferase [Terrimonas sp. NA20]|uniref:Class I SAM-dependent methyltransferase n=1 Tax=Terrimonas ginsenosidimutans TaxID=2908004 RepID=A0ABS9KPE3_9BACT|nr:class I SAM-dependent methyltransferase [Terrimonas ginsenosidimutans]MCG2614188.1 class I SAM-dependent methyltransferase [Terrimonas ginsenosidimutans]